MKHVAFAGALASVLVLGGLARAIDEPGSPTPTLKARGDWGFGLESNFSERKADLDYRILGVDIHKTSTLGRTAVAAVGAYRILDEDVPFGEIEAFLKVGAAWVEAEDALGFLTREIDADGDGEFLLGGGLRWTVWEIAEGLKLGATQQVTYYRLEDTVREPFACGGGLVTAREELEADLLDVTATLGLTWEWDVIKVYGGLLASWTFADEDVSINVGGVPIPADVRLREDGNLGAFLGMSALLADQVMLSVNGHLMEGGWGAGGAVVIRL